MYALTDVGCQYLCFMGTTYIWGSQKMRRSCRSTSQKNYPDKDLAQCAPASMDRGTLQAARMSPMNNIGSMAQGRSSPFGMKFHHCNYFYQDTHLNGQVIGLLISETILPTAIPVPAEASSYCSPSKSSSIKISSS